VAPYLSPFQVEQNKIALGISYYFINQPSLEQVRFALGSARKDGVTDVQIAQWCLYACVVYNCLPVVPGTRWGGSCEKLKWRKSISCRKAFAMYKQ